MKRKLRKSIPATSASAINLKLSTNSGINKSSSPTLHRGRKKRLQAREHVEKKKNFIQEQLDKLEEIEKEKEKQESKKNDSNNKNKNTLSSALKLAQQMTDALPDQVEINDENKNEEDKNNKSKLSHKQRRKLIEKETVQVNNVRKHASFQQDPMEALRQHLLNTVNNDPTEIPPPLKSNKKKKSVKKQSSNAVSIPKVQKEAIQKQVEEARERVIKKREEKAAYAQIALNMKKEENKNKIQKQTLTGLLARRSSRGRIGEKRPKMISK